MRKGQITIEPTLKAQLEKTEERYRVIRNLPVQSLIATKLSKAAPRKLGRTASDVLITLKKAGLLPALNETAKRIRNILDWILDQENPK